MTKALLTVAKQTFVTAWTHAGPALKRKKWCKCPVGFLCHKNKTLRTQLSDQKQVSSDRSDFSALRISPVVPLPSALTYAHSPGNTPLCYKPLPLTATFWAHPHQQSLSPLHPNPSPHRFPQHYNMSKWDRKHNRVTNTVQIGLRFAKNRLAETSHDNLFHGISFLPHPRWHAKLKYRTNIKSTPMKNPYSSAKLQNLKIYKNHFKSTTY